MLALLLLACRGADTPDVPGCVRDDDPPGDPVYRSCRVLGESASGETELHTDADGREVFWRDEGWTRTRVWDDDCEAETRTTCTSPAGPSCGETVDTRICDEAGNVLTLTETYTDAAGAVRTTITDTAYTFDDEGRAVVAISTVRGGEAPPSTTTCTYSDGDAPDTCVRNPTSDDDPVDDWTDTWSRDPDGNPLRYDVACTNPGYAAWTTWARDERGRTTQRSSYDSGLSDTSVGDYAYRDLVVDTVTWRTSGPDTSAPSTTTYTYEVLP